MDSVWSFLGYPVLHEAAISFALLGLMLKSIISPLSQQTVINLAQIFAFANSLISIFAFRFFARKAFSLFRKHFLYSLILIWIGIIICLIGIVTAIEDGNKIYVPWHLSGGVKVSIVLWTIGIVRLFTLVKKGLWLDFRQFRKTKSNIFEDPNVTLERCLNSNISYFGIPKIDEILDKAKKENRKLYYPILIVGNEKTRPWRISQLFLINSVKLNKASIYFSFSRPADYVLRQIEEKTRLDLKESNKLSIIDCYSGLYRRSAERESKNIKIYNCDPRDPGEINKYYNKVLKETKSKGLRVIYEAFSDFMYLTDREIATNFMRHNIVWEEENNVESLYVLREGIIEREFENQIIWFSNTTIYLNYNEECDPPEFKLTVRGVFHEPLSFIIEDLNSFYQFE